MTEYAILTVYVFIIGTQVGRALTLRQQANAMVEAVNCLVRSDWLTPSVLASRIHDDQECVEALPALPVVWAPSKRMPVWLELQYEFCRWRVPRLRRVK